MDLTAQPSNHPLDPKLKESLKPVPMQRYMVVEHFSPYNLNDPCDTMKHQSTILPPGLNILDQWLVEDKTQGYLLMSTSNRSLFDQWFQSMSSHGVVFHCNALCDKPTTTVTMPATTPTKTTNKKNT